jgi:hypothetical protein
MRYGPKVTKYLKLNKLINNLQGFLSHEKQEK